MDLLEKGSCAKRSSSARKQFESVIYKLPGTEMSASVYCGCLIYKVKRFCAGQIGGGGGNLVEKAIT